MATPFQPPKSLNSTPKTHQFNTPFSSTPKTSQFNTKNPSVQHTPQFNIKKTVLNWGIFGVKLRVCWTKGFFWVERRNFKCWKGVVLVLNWGGLCGTEEYSERYVRTQITAVRFWLYKKRVWPRRDHLMKDICDKNVFMLWIKLSDYIL